MMRATESTTPRYYLKKLLIPIILNWKGYKMNADYKQGYADGVSDIRNKLMMQVHDILECERESYANGGESDKNLQGWIECLEMFQNTLTGENK